MPVRLEVRLDNRDGVSESLGIAAWQALNTRPIINAGRLTDES